MKINIAILNAAIVAALLPVSAWAGVCLKEVNTSFVNVSTNISIAGCLRASALSPTYVFVYVPGYIKDKAEDGMDTAVPVKIILLEGRVL